MFTYGFYDSLNGDRRYNAKQFTSLFDGIILDGIFMSIGDRFNVTVSPNDPMELLVGSGRAWFDHSWNLNESDMILQVELGAVNLPRKDLVVLEVDRTNRTNSIKIIKGEPAKEPVAPEPIRSENLNQHVLAIITVPKDCSQLEQGFIENQIGTSACPFVTGPLETINADALLAQWNDQWTRWYNGIRDILSDVDPGGSLGVAVFDLQQDVQNLANTKYDKATAETQITNLTNQINLRHIIRYGTAAPNNSVGIDGDVYIQIMS